MPAHARDWSRERRWRRQQARKEGQPRDLSLAAFPTGLEWHVWWNRWERDVEQKEPWERALIDAVTRLVRNNLTLARMVRFEGEGGKRMIRYNSEGHVWGEETRNPGDITREAFVWFLRHIKPTEKGAPAWAHILFKGVEGCYLQQSRLGNELDGIKRKGYGMVNVSATQRPDRFEGEEVIS